MVVGDVVRYFDRVRKNVNKAFMRQVLREALGPYCQRKKSESAAVGARGWGNSAVELDKVKDENQVREEAGLQERSRGSGKQTEDVQQTPIVGSPVPMEKDMEDFRSDTTRDEDDWGASLQSPTYSPRPSDERRTASAVSRSRTLDSATAVRPGMDKAGLGSLRSLRHGLPGGDDHDDALSVRSLAMVGRSDSFSSRRSRK